MKYLGLLISMRTAAPLDHPHCCLSKLGSKESFFLDCWTEIFIALHVVHL